MRTAVKNKCCNPKKLSDTNISYNSRLNDFLFARRVYIDLTVQFLTTLNWLILLTMNHYTKEHLINRLLASEGYN